MYNEYMSRKPQIIELPQERAFLVGIELDGQHSLLSLEDSLEELTLLADTAGLSVVGSASQHISRPNPKTLVGSGKITEIKNQIENSVADVVIFDAELSPRHQRELEGIFGDDVRVLDRTALILDIFAQHAITREGALQVELAQYEYRLPRLTRAWTHLARQAGGGGGRAGSVGGVGLRGPGETQLEVDRREIGRRIANLRSQLEKVREHRGRHREQRRRAAIPTVALVGYTNAGKSTLLNQLSNANVLVADKLFATLDPTTRRVKLPGGNEVLFTDTVGFIQKLPTTLVAAFRATLEEIGDSDLLLHVVDVTHPNVLAHAEAVRSTLDEIVDKDIPRFTALNKIDRLANPESVHEFIDEFERAVPISALRGEGIASLLSAIEIELNEQLTEICVEIPYRSSRLISLFHQLGRVEHQENRTESVILSGRIPQKYLPQYQTYLMKRNRD